MPSCWYLKSPLIKISLKILQYLIFGIMAIINPVCLGVVLHFLLMVQGSNICSKLGLCRIYSYFCHNKVFGTSCAKGRLQNDPHLEATLSHGEHGSTNLGVKSIFPRFRAYKSLGNQMVSG
jgi:hypothetical protein